MKIRFLEPGNRPYKPTPLNYFVYDRYIRTPSVGLNTLATIVKELVDDTYMYSESISRIDMDDVEDADIVFIGERCLSRRLIRHDASCRVCRGRGQRQAEGVHVRYG